MNPNSPNLTAPAGVKIPAARRVKIVNAGGRPVAGLAGAADRALGTSITDVDGDVPSKRTLGLQPLGGGLHEVTLGNATAVVPGDELQGAADGKVVKRTTGLGIGEAYASAGTDGDIFRAVLWVSGTPAA